MDPSTQPKVVVRPQSIRIDSPKEQKFVTDALMLLNATRQAMGWTAAGTYTKDSWLHKRQSASQRYKDNFTDRLDPSMPKLWKTSNKSLNLPSVVIDQHISRLGKDFGTDGFLALRSDPEDQGYILKPAEQFLQKRASKTRLGWKIRQEGIRGALIRGEAVFKALRNATTRTVSEKLRILMQPRLNGPGLEPAMDSKGGFIHERDVWIPHSEDPTLEVLQRDPLTQRPIGGIPTYSDQPREVEVTVSEPAGSDIAYPFWADFVADLDAPDLSRATIKAHLFEMKVDDLWDMLPKHLLTPAAEQYYKQASAPASNAIGRLQAEQSVLQWKSGELPGSGNADVAVDAAGIIATRLYAEIWIRYDLDGDRHREDLCLLIDVGEQWPISYGHAHEVLGEYGRTHPFGIERIYPEEKRWYGQGLYAKSLDLSDEIDADYNRLAIEKAKSGNILIEDRDATLEGKAGIPIEFRTPRTFKKAYPAEDRKPLDVISVTPIITDIEKSMQNNMTAFMSRFGGITPGDTQGQQLAANTATGLQILQETKNEAVEQRAEELREGPHECDGLKGHLRLFAQLELLNMSPREVNEEFGNSQTRTGKQVPLLGPNGQPILEPIPMAMPDGTAPIERSADTPSRFSGDPVRSQNPPASGSEPNSAPIQPPPTTANDGEAVPEQPPTPQVPMQPVMVDETVPTAASLLEWAKNLTPSRIHAMVQLVISRSRSTQILQTNDNILIIVQKWLTYPPEVQEILKPLFVEMMLALDVPDPTDLLDRLHRLGATNPEAILRVLSDRNNPAPPRQGGGPDAAPAGGGHANRAPRTGAENASAEKPVFTGRPDSIPNPNSDLAQGL